MGRFPVGETTVQPWFLPLGMAEVSWVGFGGKSQAAPGFRVFLVTEAVSRSEGGGAGLAVS